MVDVPRPYQQLKEAVCTQQSCKEGTFETLMLVVKALEDSAFLARLQHVRLWGQVVHLSSCVWKVAFLSSACTEKPSTNC